MGFMKRRATAKLFASTEGSKTSEPLSEKSLSDGTPPELLTFAPCIRCGRSKFILRYKCGKVRYTISAVCASCGASRVVSLDAAHEATKRAGKSGRRKRKSRSKSRRDRLPPSTNAKTRVRASKDARPAAP